jgi:hypothetical protein
MTITLNLPEDIARHLAARGEDPARAALEALALEGYRSRNLSEEQIRRMLGFDTHGSACFPEAARSLFELYDEGPAGRSRQAAPPPRMIVVADATPRSSMMTLRNGDTV